MKKSSNKIPIIGIGTAIVLGVTCLTVFSAGALVKTLNADADMQYVAAVNEANAAQSQAMQEHRGNDNNDSSADVSSEDGTSLVSQSSGDISSAEDNTENPSDTKVEAGDVADVTYPYFIGKNFVIVDPEGNIVYVVEKGDTLSKISGIVGYSVNELAEYNKISNVNLIYTDESLRIPADEDTVAAVKAYVEASDSNSVSGNSLSGNTVSEN